LTLFLLLSALAWPGGLFGPFGLSAQQGVVGGVVVAAGTLEPLSGAQVAIVGTNLGGLTNDAGRFLIEGISGTEVTVQVVLLGYGTTTVQATVGVTNLRISLGQAVVMLDELVVTGTAGDTRRRVLGNAVSSIDASATLTAPVENLGDLLKGRATGVVVTQGSGVAGSTREIRIRGRSSMQDRSDAPLLVVDGVRVNNRLFGNFADPAFSRLDDIDPANIESIEIIKGPAAATLYGTEASNGVIQIITKKGSAGPAVWSATMRQGAGYFHDAADRIGDFYGEGPSGEIIQHNPIRAEEARGTPIFSTAREQFYNLSVRGGTDAIQYYLSGSATLNDGVTDENTSDKYNAQFNLNIAPSSKLRISTSTGLVINRARFPDGFNGIMAGVLWGTPSSLHTENRGFYFAPPETLIEAYQNNHNVNRATLGISVEHNTTDWLTQRLTGGMDFTDQVVSRYTPRLGEFDSQFFSPREAGGSKTVDREDVLYKTLEYTATASLRVSQDLTSNTSGGFQVNQRNIRFTEAEGEGFPATGVGVIAGAGTYQRGRDDFLENNTVGVFLQEQFGWQDRLFLTVAIRADDNSAFGEDFDLVYYPKVSGSWVLSEESFWNFDWANAFRLRAAYGESGQQPDAFAALRTYEARAHPAGKPTITPSASGNAELGPERGKEIEVGFDLALLNDRVGVDFTYYDQTTTDAILSRNVAPSTGFAGNQFVNVGEVTNSGFEVGINALVLDRPDFDWDLGVAFSTNDNEITKLGIDGYLYTGWTTRHQEGYPVSSFFAPILVSAEMDADNIAYNLMCKDGEGGTVSCDDAPYLYTGQPGATLEGSVNTTVTLFDRIKISGMLDFQRGQAKYITDRWNRCAWQLSCEINYYPERFPVIDAAAAQNGGWYDFQWTTGVRSDFARLREVSVEYPVPEAWAQRLGAASGTISLGARNLATFTDYPGLDPETMDLTSSISEPNDQVIIPPLRQFMLSVHFTW
jgi:TonB-dependent SusC/RagA subfamily outer membrane receptor